MIVKVISAVVGALGTTPKKLRQQLRKQQLSDIRIETIVGFNIICFVKWISPKLKQTRSVMQ